VYSGLWSVVGAWELLVLGVIESACWWVRWACVHGESRIRRATEVGVNKSADLCLVDFAVARKGVGFIIFNSANNMDHSCSEVHRGREADLGC